MAPTSDVGSPGRSVPTALGVPTRAHLDQARSHLVAATDALDGWSARRTDPGHNYVRDGHEAIRLIDAAAQQLSGVRAVLVGQLRADEDEGAAGVDRLLADRRAGQGRRSGLSRRQPGSGRGWVVNVRRLASLTAGGTGRAPARTRRPIGQTRELAAKVRAQNPQISQAELARELGISATRVRQVDRAEVRPELPPGTRNGDLATRGGTSP